MLRTAGFTILLVAIVTLSAHTSFAASESLDRLGSDVLETLQSFYPVRSTRMGIHAYDHRFADYSSQSVKAALKKLNDHEQKLYKFKTANLPLHDQINYKLLKSNVDIAILDLKRIEWHKKSPVLYAQEVLDGVYLLAMSDFAPLDQRMVSIINRMKAVPGYLTTARVNIKKPPKVLADAGIQTLESGIDFYKDIAAELSNKFPERADELMRVSTQAREAMNDFITYLSSLSYGPETGFSIGKDNFDYMLSNEYLVGFNSDSLLKLGESLFERANSAYHEYLGYVENNQNGQDSVFVPAAFSRQDILDYYNWETDQIKKFLRANDIITIPENIAPVEVVETPSYLRTVISGIAYEPAGPFDSVQTGYFYVRPIPTDLDRRQLEARYRYIHRRGFKGSAVHEAFPGHHLQLQLAGMNDDPVRKWQMNAMMIEGWALYCEEMMYHQGLYGNEDPVQWLAVLKGIRFRAARIIADVKLHTGQFTYEECVRWMGEALGVDSDTDREYIRREVLRYLTTPTYQMAYLTGKLEIMNLLETAKNRPDRSFDLKGFHDALLTEGSIPPTLMWEVMGLSKR